MAIYDHCETSFCVTCTKYVINVNNNGLLDLSNIGCDPFLVGLLLVLPLKAKLVSTVLGPWFVDT